MSLKNDILEDKAPQIKYIGTHHIQDRGHVYFIPNPETEKDFNWILGKIVKIDGKDRVVKGIERHGTSPIKKGVIIGLLV